MKTIISSRKLIIDYKLEYEQLPDTDFIVYKKTKNSNEETSSTISSKTHIETSQNEEQGITTLKSLRDFANGKTQTIESAKIKNENRAVHVIAVKKEYLETLRNYGFTSEKDVCLSYQKNTIENPYDAYCIKPDDFLLIAVDVYCNRVFDINGEPVPVCVYCDYINGHFSNDAYNLRKVVDILSKRKDVVLQEDRWAYLRKNQSVYERYISAIEGYNATQTRNASIAFKWCPSNEDYKTVYKNTKQGFASFFVSMFETDILGLRSAHAAKYNDYFAHDKDDDESYDNE